MKKASAILLFLVMILCSSGFFIAFQISLRSIKHTQRQIILSSDLKDKFIFEFAFAKKVSKNQHQDISFVEKDEIRYRGKMYDIISQHEKGDSIFIKCINDEQEDYTIALSENNLVKDQQARNEKNLSLLKFNLDVYTSISDKRSLLSFSIKQTIKYHFPAKEKLLFPIINVPSPPPWC
jgi:DNA gyrase/topoisomerase IV subunit A